MSADLRKEPQRVDQVDQVDQVGAMFASSSVPVHVVRGVIGAVLAVAAFVLAARSGGASMLLLVPAALAWRGCPTCWALGLVSTRARCRISGR